MKPRPSKKGQHNQYLYTKDKSRVPKFFIEEENLSIMDKLFRFHCMVYCIAPTRYSPWQSVTSRKAYTLIQTLNKFCIRHGPACNVYDIYVCACPGQLYCLQTRPIVTLLPSCFFDHSASGSHATLWDNSNIVESYSGVTSPLTFSFISKAYHDVSELDDMYHVAICHLYFVNSFFFPLSNNALYSLYF